MNTTMYLGIDGSQPARSVTLEIPEGDRGTEATIKWIRRLIYEGVRDPKVNRAALSIVQNAPAHDQAAEARAIYQWVRQNIRFTGDIYSAETLRPAKEMLDFRGGDCDCINGVLIPTLLESVGIESRLVTVAADDSRPETFSHIYPQANLDGRWVAMDAAAQHAAFGKEPAHVYRQRIWDVHSSAYEDVTPGSASANAARMSALHGLGQDDDGGGFDWSALSQVITAGTVGAANVIKAVSAPYAPTTTLSPTTAYRAAVPGVAQASYPVAGVTTSGGSSATIVMGGLAILLVALLFLSK